MFEQTFKNIDDILHKDAGCRTEINNHIAVYAWVAGPRLFTIRGNGELSARSTDASLLEETHVVRPREAAFEIGMANVFGGNKKILEARSGLFGAIIEVCDDLYSVSEGGIEIVAVRPGAGVFFRDRETT